MKCEKIPEKLNILVLSNRPTVNSQAGTVFDHLDAFHKYSSHQIFELSTIHNIPSSIDLNKFDVIVVHYTLGIGFEHFISQKTKNALGQSNAIKVVFIQDEYRIINKVNQSLVDLDADILFTCVPQSEIHKVYSKNILKDLTIINNLTGYAPEHTSKNTLKNFNERQIDVGYRSRKTPFWLGTLGLEKWKIVDNFIENTKNSNLITDLSYNESDRIYGKSWPIFLSSCKSVLGVESGSSIFDFTGEVQNNVENYVSKNPNADFNEVFEIFLKDLDGNIKLNQISARVFESAMYKTLMILFEGEYSGILTPWKHYVPLKKDFSNIDEVLAIFENPKKAQNIIDIAYNDLIVSGSYSYKKFIGVFDVSVYEKFSDKGNSKVTNGYSKVSFKLSLYSSIDYLFRYLFSAILQRLVLGCAPVRKYVFLLFFSMPLGMQKKIRPFAKYINK